MTRIKRNLKPRTEDGMGSDGIGDDDDGGLDTVIVTAPAPKPKPSAKPKTGKKPPTAETPPVAIAKTASGGVAYPVTRLHDYEAVATVGKKKKKPTKKQQASLDQWKGNHLAKTIDTYVIEMARQAKKEFGHGSVWAGDELNSLIVGIPLPSLALEFLIDNDVFPLSLIIVLMGKKKTFKSTFLYEIIRWFALYNGMAFHQEVESKFDEELFKQILRVRNIEHAPVIINKCTSQEDWQSRLIFYLKEHKRRLLGTAEVPGPGRTVPTVYSVDSVAGKTSVERQEKIQKEGSAEREGPIEAMKNTSFFPSMTHQFENWPFSLVLVNHIKPGCNMSGKGDSGPTSPGGAIIGYLESLELHTSLWQSKITSASFDGAGVRLTCANSSFGMSHRSVKTRILWWDTKAGEKDGKPTYETHRAWDWDWATITMLNELDDKYKKRLKEAGFHLMVKSPTAEVDCLAQSKTLGMGKEDWLKFHEVGAMIRENVEVTNLIRTALGIKRRALFNGDYLKQIDQLQRGLR